MTDQEWQLCGLPVVKNVKLEVLRDVRSGLVPRTCSSFSELHDYVDANCYGWEDGDSFDPGDEEFVNFWNRVQDAVDDWIRQGGLLGVRQESR